MNQKSLEKQEQESIQNKKGSIPLKEVEQLLAKQEAHILNSLQIQMTQVRQGPTPSPEELKQLKQIDKSFPDRIILMAEKEQKFRHTSTYIGQINFILLVLLGYSIAGFTGYFGLQWVGVTVALGVSYIVYVFKAKDPKPPKPPQNTNQNN